MIRHVLRGPFLVLAVSSACDSGSSTAELPPDEPPSSMEFVASPDQVYEVHRMFTQALIVNALGSEGDEALSAWMLALHFAELPETPRVERTTIWSNAARYFQQSDSNWLVASELWSRVLDDPETLGTDRAIKERSALWEAHTRPEVRHALALCDWVPPGAAVSLDGLVVCTAPCVAPVPVDGQAHLLHFEWSDGSNEYTWTPSKATSLPPWLQGG